jgi:hypothetical protein
MSISEQSRGDELRELVGDLRCTDEPGILGTLAANMEPQHFDDLLKFIEKRCALARIEELTKLRDDYGIDLKYYEYDRVDSERLNPQETGEQSIAWAVNDYIADRIAQLTHQTNDDERSAKNETH